MPTEYKGFTLASGGDKPRIFAALTDLVDDLVAKINGRLNGAPTDPAWNYVSPPTGWTINTTGGEQLCFSLVNGVVWMRGGFNSTKDAGFYPWILNAGGIPAKYRPSVQVMVTAKGSNHGILAAAVEPNGSVHAETLYSAGDVVTPQFWRFDAFWPASNA